MGENTVEAHKSGNRITRESKHQGPFSFLPNQNGFPGRWLTL
jgi:hypothetical protein